MAPKPEDIPITLVQQIELTDRLEAYQRNPNVGASWGDVCTRFRAIYRWVHKVDGD